MNDSEKPALQPANENPWYCLATLYGEQPEDILDEDLTNMNRLAWNRFMSSAMRDEERAAIAERFSEDELLPLKSAELDDYRRAYAVRTNHKMELPAIDEVPCDFSFTHFEREVIFADFLFLGAADFSSAKFARSVDFGGATFELSNFKSATFEEYADFHSAIFSDAANFESAAFLAYANFGSVTFSGPADFGSARFLAYANFESVMFARDASFGSARFDDVSPFNSVKFSGHADFTSTTFSSVSMSSTTFAGAADFISARFSKAIDFESAIFSADADFSSATFSDCVYFNSSTFSRFTSFDSAKFSSVAFFHNVKFAGWTRFIGTNFDLIVPDFRGAALHEGTEWHGSIWPKPPKTTGHAQEQVYAYERLKQEMDRLKKHDDEQRFFRRELRARRKLARPLSGEWTLNFLYQAISNYGYSIALPLIWLFGLFVTGAAVFYLMHATNPSSGVFTIWHAAAVSFGNIFPFAPIAKELMSASPVIGWSRFEKAIAVGQTLLGTPLLFLLGLALRNRFRMK